MARRRTAWWLVIAALFVVSACSGTAEFGTSSDPPDAPGVRVAGRTRRNGEEGPILLFFENRQTEAAVSAVILPGEEAFSVQLAPGSYRAWGWSADFVRRARLIGSSNPSQDAENPEATIEVQTGAPVDGLVIGGWEDRPGVPLAIRGRLIDGRGGEPMEDGVVVVREERIVAAGRSSEVTIPPNATVVEFPDATILPGLINAHVHNAYRARMLQRWAQEGVTTVRDLGAPVGTPYFALRNQLAQDPANARLVAAGPLVTVPGGYPIAGNNFPSLTVTSPDDARAKIDRLIDDGADVIKITIASGSAPILSPEEAAAIVETAHARGIPVSVHATNARDLERALEAGVDDVCHMATDRVSGRTIDRMVAEGVAWVPTLDALGNEGGGNLRRFVAAGGIVALGNDGGYLEGLEVGLPIHEMELMRNAGMTSMEVIVAATRDAARVCRLDAALGTLEVGKLADVLVVRGDPSADLEALTRVQLVVHAGEIIRDERGH
jgi:imidazolonepropionase-like amidohydrolase